MWTDRPCRLWEGSTNAAGYGRRWLGNRLRSVHRLAWEEAYGPIPDVLSVLHHCDTPPCYEPTHLFLGTQLDNMRDAAAKGRIASGSRLPHTKVTPALLSAVDSVRPLRPGGGQHGGIAQAARENGVARSTIRRWLSTPRPRLDP